MSNVSIKRWSNKVGALLRNGSKNGRKNARSVHLQIERLEDRWLPSVMSPDFIIYHPVGEPQATGGSSTYSGTTPAVMQTAYGITTSTGADLLTFGAVAGNGAGQTIAIVDAYNQPNIVNDLANFDSTFHLPAPPSFKEINESGGSALPSNASSGGWGVEISLDVEWAHSIAPGASILLVEANSANNSDLFAAVNTARNYANVSVISMSFSGNESSRSSRYNTDLTTPSGHNGVTFLAATGDNGAAVGYPAVSPDVVAVGGTTLSTGSGGVWSSETGWSGSGGGISSYTSQPSFQHGVVTQSTTRRTVPDVSMDADPNTGVPVYDSYDEGASTPWVQVGGTSLATPMWAGVIAIADQGRKINGEGTLDGPTATLPMLYALATPLSSSAGGYTSGAFHDITSGSNGYSAGPGYDLVTGIGSPIVNVLVPDLVGNVAPAVTAQPSSQTAVAGSTVTFTVAASGNPTPSVQWEVSNGQSGFSPINGATSTTLTLVNVAASQNGDEYEAVFTNSSGSVTTASATLTVDTLPAVTAAPANQSVDAGGTAMFSAAAAGNPTPTVQWQLSTDGGASWSNVSGATSTTLTVSGVAGTQNGAEYEAIFTNSVGSVTTSPATLTVDYVTLQPVSQTINDGQSASFNAATSNPSGLDAVQWQVNTGSGFTNLTDGGVYSGSATTTLTITGAVAAMSGYQYEAVFTNSAGSLTAAATLTVTVPVSSQPALAGLPVVNGSSAMINIVSASGDGTTATVTTDGTPHGFWVGELVTLTGTSPGGPGGLAGTVTVTGVPSATTFQFASTYLGSETLSGATVTAALAGVQRSMVDSIVYNFSEPVNLTAAAFSISVVVDNNSTGDMVGMAPTLNVAAVPFTNEWVVTFTDAVNGSVIGNSIANGAYSISINPALVTAVSGQNLLAGESDTFYRLFGDVTGAQSVTNVDVNAFNRAWGNAYYSAGYNAALDYNDDGKYTNIDANAFNRAFNTRYNVVTTI